MPRGYPDWDMSGETEDRIARELAAEVYRGVPPGTDSVAAERQVGREELTARLAGTSDRSSRAWKTARDNLTRWRSGRRAIGPRNAAKLRAAVEAARRDRIRESRVVNVTITANWQTSRTAWIGKAVADLTGEDLADFLTALEQRDYVGALQIAAEAYGLDPEFVMSINELGEVTVSSDAIPGN
ncbi:hypothetical protein [Pseudonocardia spinosispora]|uniref:hypothetical protein n=1 Tax=Pseudonocardia spinosispora TaxID=103441 RepID=UPI0004165AF5|nr:hypothetical protein [Pseudonocardia spinosispora]